MIKEITKEGLPEVLRTSYDNWEQIFKDKMKNTILNSLAWQGEDKNLRAFNSKEDFIEWYCYHPSEAESYRDDGFYPRELTFLSDYVKPNFIIELGTSLGMGTFMLSMLNPDAVLYTVDNKDMQYLPGYIKVSTGYISRLNNVYCQYINGESYKTKIPEKFHLCFIDADHSGETVWKDTLWAWANKSNKYAIIWHDYRVDNSEFDGLIESIKKFSTITDIYKLKDSSTVWTVGGIDG